jgi:hypothetical protein
VYTEDLTVNETLKRTHALICDMNDDNIINCIDYSLLFRKIYGKEVQLIINTKMNHMLVAIKGQPIEPQGNSTNWAPAAFWGKQYDSVFNIDVTATWDHYIKWETPVRVPFGGW